jgi:hypothetical protein
MQLIRGRITAAFLHGYCHLRLDRILRGAELADRKNFDNNKSGRRGGEEEHV